MYIFAFPDMKKYSKAKTLKIFREFYLCILAVCRSLGTVDVIGIV